MLRLNQLFSFNRKFSQTAISLAKKGKSSGKGKQSKEEDLEPTTELNPKQILSDIGKQYDNTVTIFNKKLTELKMGKANPNIFDSIKIKVDDSYTASFPELATTTMKGSSFLNVTVFDPSNTKKIVSAILASNLNLNPEVDPKNEQLLKIKLPNSTKDLKAQQLKEMKQLLDHYKSSASNKSSLIFIRSKFMKDLKGVEGSKDSIRKLTTEIDSVFKKYSETLSNVFKNAEKSLR